MSWWSLASVHQYLFSSLYQSVLICLRNFKMRSDQRFPEHFTDSESQENASLRVGIRAIENLIQSHFVVERQPPPEQERELDILYSDICEKELPPKQLFKRGKSMDRINPRLPTEQAGFRSRNDRHLPTQSLQTQINTANYRQLLRNQFGNQVKRDKMFEQLQEKYMVIAEENQKLKAQNDKLRRAYAKQQKEGKKKTEKIVQLENQNKQLRRRCESLIKENEANDNRKSKQLKKVTNQKQDYRKLVEGLKESIRVLKGKQVHGISDLWREWKSIFELASLQQCKISKKRNKF